MWDNVTVLEEHTSGTPLYTPSSWYTLGKFWYTLGRTIHPVDKHYSKRLRLSQLSAHSVRSTVNCISSTLANTIIGAQGIRADLD